VSDLRLQPDLDQAAEEPLTALRNYTRFILEIASGDAMDTELALGVQQIARDMNREIEAADNLRSGIFHATPPEP
jgi:hypothetical protein